MEKQGLSKDLGVLEGDVLIFGGPYSNLPATRAFLAVAESEGIPPERIICTGDVVAYCSKPEATVQLIRDSEVHCLMGNCEESLAEDALDCGCGFEENSACDLLSAQWYRFSRANVSKASKLWMGSLPRTIRFSMSGIDCLMVHGSVSHINQFVFPSSDSLMSEQLEVARSENESAVDVVIGGHSGIPFGKVLGNGVWLNAGVIGMPANDGTDTGWYMRLSQETNGVKASWHRLPYDVDHASKSMVEQGLDNGYRLALQTGHWPSTDVLPEEDKQRTGQAIELAPIWLTPSK